MFIYIVSGAIFALLSVMSLFLFLTVRSLPTFVALLLTLIGGGLTLLMGHHWYVEQRLLREITHQLELGQQPDETALPPTARRIAQLFREQVESACQQPSDEQDLKFKVLQNQVNPHFLYNTLESIRSVALCDGEAGLPQIAAMTEALAKYFRYNISYSNDLVALLDELENINQYMLIQQFRFSDRFHFEVVYRCGMEAVQTIMLPKLILQPIIENAIFHGLERKIEPGIIVLTISETEQRVILQIQDDGVGMTDEVLFRLQQTIAQRQYRSQQRPDSGHNGVALWQVNQQIRTLFGSEYGLQIFSTLGVGTTVEITLPVVRNQ